MTLVNITILIILINVILFSLSSNNITNTQDTSTLNMLEFLDQNSMECEKIIKKVETEPIFKILQPFLGISFRYNVIDSNNFIKFKEDYRKRVRKGINGRFCIYFRSDTNVTKRIKRNMQYYFSHSLLMNDVNKMTFNPQKIYVNYKNVVDKFIVLCCFIPLGKIHKTKFILIRVKDRESNLKMNIPVDKILKYGVFVEEWNEGEKIFNISENDPVYRLKCFFEEFDLFIQNFKKYLELYCVLKNKSFAEILNEEKNIDKSGLFDTILNKMYL